MITEHTTAPKPSPPPGEDRGFPSGIRFEFILRKLGFWGRFVGFLNTATGIIYCLGIFALAVPLVFVGILQVAMGVKLMRSAWHSRRVLTTDNTEELADALNNLRSYLVFNAIVLSFSFVFLLALVIGLAWYGTFFWELWDTGLDDLVRV